VLKPRRFASVATREFIAKLGPWAPLALIGLRSLSIIIPAIPSTLYSILAGALFGFGSGILYIAIADFISCTLNFYLARKFGRDLVQRVVGRQWMYKVDALSANYLENNIFLTAGFLMTGLFDFVAYAAGLTQIKWQNFLLALALGHCRLYTPSSGSGGRDPRAGKVAAGLCFAGNVCFGDVKRLAE
jgi:uncharacterized membrane protein YdjX (TVP38/TMEM64 family)